MSYSTNDELEAIERAARSTSPMPERPLVTVPNPKGRRRGSSNFAMPKSPTMNSKTTSTVEIPPQIAGQVLLEPFSERGREKPIAPGYVPDEHNEEDFHEYQAPANPPPQVNASAPKRGSVVLKPMAGIGGLVDFNDSDFDDSDDEGTVELPGKPMPGAGPSHGASVGGPNHRPLVGGFAAAAYEAARAHHYANIDKGKEKAVIPKRSGPPPSI